MSNLIDFDLMVDEPDEPKGADEAKKAASELEEIRPAERMSIRARSDLRLPHPPGPRPSGRTMSHPGTVRKTEFDPVKPGEESGDEGEIDAR